MITLGANDLEKGYFSNIMREIFISSSVRPLPVTLRNSLLVHYPSNIKLYLDKLYGAFNASYKINTIDKYPKFKVEKTNKMLVAFSGGKDSVATALKSRALGYEPILYHIMGINRSYAQQELAHAMVLSMDLKMPIVVRQMSMSGKCDYTENPTKNQFVLAHMVEYGIRNGVTNYTFGNMKEDTMEFANPDCNLSDCIEMHHALDPFFKESIDGYQFHVLIEGLTDSYRWIWNTDKTVLENVSSCMAPIRYKKNFRKHNEEKYKIELLPDRCGSCKKCAIEYVTWSLFRGGYINMPYFKHCLEILRKKLPENFPNYTGLKDDKSILDRKSVV